MERELVRVLERFSAINWKAMGAPAMGANGYQQELDEEHQEDKH
jgi:hypothetical protein